MSLNAPRIGIVTATGIKNGRVVVDVAYDKPGSVGRDISFFQPVPGALMTPSEGDRVQVYRLGDKSHVAMFPVNGSTLAPASMNPGEMEWAFDANTKIRVVRNPGDTAYDLHLEASGDVHISASGDVYIEGIDFDSHTHDFNYSWGDTSGSSSGTTSTPQ